MTSPEQIVQELLLTHGEQPYDPIKAREYYLRTRELKGRRSGAGSTTSTRSRSRVARPVLKKAPSFDRKALEGQVASIAARLGALQKVLAELVQQQKEEREAASKKDAKKETGSASGGGSSKEKKPLTAKQKADQAKRSKEHYEKNVKPANEKLKKLKGKELDAKIVEIRGQMQKMRTDLNAAKQKLQSQGLKPTRGPDLAGRPAGHPEYGNDPPA